MHNLRAPLCLVLLLAACPAGPPGDDGDHNLSTSSTGDLTTTGVSTVTGATTGMTEATSSTTDDTSGTDSDSVSTSTTSTTDATTSTTGPQAVCGNGTVEGDEACDDGNDDDTDDCKTDCTLPVCGDGITYKGIEECDDGNLISTDSCTEKCEDAECGDGYQYLGFEVCDDGDEDNTNGCTELCELPECGDGFVHKGFEVCDDGLNDNTYGGCAPGCTKFGPYCGDGVPSTKDGERCDTSDPYLGVGCTGGCTYNFAMVPQLYCHNTCSWGGPNGCDQADADIYCKLKTGNPSSVASKYTMSMTATPLLPGFGCGNPNKYVDDGMGKEIRKNLGELPEYGVMQPVFYVEKNMSETHAGNAITSVTCVNG